MEMMNRQPRGVPDSVHHDIGIDTTTTTTTADYYYYDYDDDELLRKEPKRLVALGRGLQEVSRSDSEAMPDLVQGWLFQLQGSVHWGSVPPENPTQEQSLPLA